MSGRQCIGLTGSPDSTACPQGTGAIARAEAGQEVFWETLKGVSQAAQNASTGPCNSSAYIFESRGKNRVIIIVALHIQE